MNAEIVTTGPLPSQELAIGKLLSPARLAASSPRQNAAHIFCSQLRILIHEVQPHPWKYMEAEQKKYELGNSTIFFVLQAQGALATAESSVVQNSVGYRRNLMNLLLRTADLLEARGITVQ